MKTIDFQEKLRVFEVVGEVMFRIGYQSPVSCKIIVAPALRYANGCVIFNELVAGHETYDLPSWFYDWDDERDNMTGSGQDGRLVEIAIPSIVYEAVQTNRNVWSHGFVRSGKVVSTQLITENESLSGVIWAPIAAYRINDRWITIEESMIVSSPMATRINNPRQ